MNADTPDALAAFGQENSGATSARALADMVERNPVPAVLAAAAAGAGLMALVALMARRDAPNPLAPVPLVSPRTLDYEALRQQVTDLADRFTRAVPVDAARQQAEQASSAIADRWSTVREQALDALQRLEPKADAAIQVARENPVWTALAVGAIGALLGSQLLGKSDEAGSST